MTQIGLANCAGQPIEHRRLNLRALKLFGGLAEISHHLREARAPESRRNLTWILLQGCAARSIQVECALFNSPMCLQFPPGVLHCVMANCSVFFTAQYHRSHFWACPEMPSAHFLMLASALSATMLSMLVSLLYACESCPQAVVVFRQ